LVVSYLHHVRLEITPGRELLQQGSNFDALPQVSGSANGAADWIKSKTGFDPRSIGEWTHTNLFKCPKPTKNGAALLR
jgi:hypothetical protein